MEINIQQAYSNILAVFQAGLVPMLGGSPGVGKSDIYHQIAKDYKLKVIDFRLSQADPTDLCGFPTLNKETGKSYYAPPEMFPLEGDSIPDGFTGWLLLLDEVNSAPLAVQAAAYKLTLDRMVGLHRLHKNVAIGCAGNLSSDRAIVNRMSTAMQSRMIHFTLEVDSKVWLEWAYNNKIDYRIIAFIQFRPELLHKFDPKHTGDTFPCPRTWHFLSRLTTTMKNVEDSAISLIAGTVGEGPAYEFAEFCKIYGKLPTMAQIEANPESVIIPDEPSTLYALSSLFSSQVNENNIDACMKVVNKLPIEFQVLSIRGMEKLAPSVRRSKSVLEWISLNAKELT